MRYHSHHSQDTTTDSQLIMQTMCKDDRDYIGRKVMTAKQSIHRAFRALLKQLPLSRITITQICDEANVNRQTFYYHYQDILHLVKAILFEEISDEIAKGRAYDTWKHGFLTATTFFRDHHAEFMNIYYSNYWEEINRHFSQLTHQLLTGVIEECLKTNAYRVSEQDKDFIIRFYRLAFNGVMSEWVTEGMSNSPEELLAQLEKVVDGTMCTALSRFSKR